MVCGEVVIKEVVVIVKLVYNLGAGNCGGIKFITFLRGWGAWVLMVFYIY